VIIYGALGKKINHNMPGKMVTHQRPVRDEYSAADQMLSKYGIQAKNRFQIKFLYAMESLCKTLPDQRIKANNVDKRIG
jgi:hypothetical protein